MAIHHEAPEQHYTALMAHSGLPYDINPPPRSADFICKVAGGDKLFIFSPHPGANGDANTHTFCMYAPATHLGLQHAHRYTHTHAYTRAWKIDQLGEQMPTHRLLLSFPRRLSPAITRSLIT